MIRRRVWTAILMTMGLLAAVTPGPVRASSSGAQAWDFDGDGYADLAVGIPSAAHARGSVSVLYSGASVLSAAGDQCWDQDSKGIKEQAQKKDHFGASLASGDFDRDGYADLAIGVPGERVGGIQAGAVQVLYGSRHGLTAAGDQLFTPGNLVGAATAKGLGASLAAADVDGDGYADLVAGAPMTANLDGIAVVLFGGPGGLTHGDAVLLDRSMTGAVDDPEVEDYWFGATAAAGDLNGDGYADLVVGDIPADAPSEVAVFPGSASGPMTGDAELWGQATPGIENAGGPGGRFGASLAIADFNGDGYDDLAAGAPDERLGEPADEAFAAGAVNVIYGSSGGLTAEGNQLWSQGSPGVPGHDEAYDRFGRAVAAGDFDSDGYADLAIGVPGENRGADRVTGKGAVVVLHGSAIGLTSTGAVRWTQDSPGVPGTAERIDGFGWSMVAADFGRSGAADLAIGVVREALKGVDEGGLVDVLYGSGHGLSAKHAQAWSKATAGIKGRVRSENFGEVLGGVVIRWP